MLRIWSTGIEGKERLGLRLAAGLHGTRISLKWEVKGGVHADGLLHGERLIPVLQGRRTKARVCTMAVLAGQRRICMHHARGRWRELNNVRDEIMRGLAEGMQAVGGGWGRDTSWDIRRVGSLQSRYYEEKEVITGGIQKWQYPKQ